VLVTGGAGFVGSHLATALARENDVRVIDDLSTGERSRLPDDAQFVRGDVRDRGLLARAMADVDVVFHQAAMVSVERSVAAPRESQSVNAAATLELLEVARNVGARVVVASSAAVYGNPASVPIDESAPMEPTSPYGVDKLTADHYARLYADLYDLPTVTLRHFNVYGPGHSGGSYSGVIAVFTEQAPRG
jgi:UDP-glucose 4-epimerase